MSFLGTNGFIHNQGTLSNQHLMGFFFICFQGGASTQEEMREQPSAPVTSANLTFRLGFP